DGSSDFKLLDRQVVDQYIALPEVGRFFRGLTTWLGFSSVAIEFDPPQRQTGRSSWSISNLLNLARSTIISFSSLPLRAVTWLGGLGVLFSIGLTLQTLWYHWQGLAEEGFPTVILLILGMGSMILLGLGLIGEYIAEIYWEVKRRPTYVIA
ncbi:MAG: glycosyltransferase, partial [Candidatus Thiodiazotropha sp.]|nr:glycosyltransferase [Candidatus Thiodiazotropha sp.]